MSVSEKAFNKRGKLSDKFVYKVFVQPFCFQCAYFRFSNSKENVSWRGRNSCGSCGFLREKGAYAGVMSSAVCNKFQSNTGRV